MRALLAAVIPGLLFAGCVHQVELRPAPSATLAPGQTNVAVQEVAGVRVAAAANEWKGWPPDLPSVLTPIHVWIDNNSGRTLRVQYRDFELIGSSGFHYAALPPFIPQRNPEPRSSNPSVGRIQRAIASFAEVEVLPEARLGVVVRPHYPAFRFFIAPHYYPYYWGWGPVPYVYHWDPWFYDYYYHYWPTALPSQDMLQKALPEGAVDTGGHVDGFLYFQHISEKESGATLQFILVDGKTGQQFGTVNIPFAAYR